MATPTGRIPSKSTTLLIKQTAFGRVRVAGNRSVKCCSILVLMVSCLLLQPSGKLQAQAPKECSDRRVDSVFRSHFKTTLMVLAGKKRFHEQGKEFMYTSYFLSAYNTEPASIGIDYAGILTVDKVGLNEWKAWYKKHKCYISWEDWLFAIQPAEKPSAVVTPEYLEKHLQKVDSLFTH